MSEPTASADYRPDIDGLRAIAVTAVVLFHADVRSFSGGFLGVDVFFVVSGFLIASNIRREVDRQTFSFRRFYERRVRRIIPALMTVLAASMVTAYFVLPSGSDFSLELLAALAFVPNLYFWRTIGYFGSAADTSPLLHTWSLGVEEQFYFLFPLGFVLLLSRDRRRAVPVMAGVILASWLLGATWPWIRPGSQAAFYLLPARAWELLLGVLLALWPSPLSTSRLARNVASIVGVAALVAGVLWFDAAVRYPVLAATVPVLGTALLIDANRREPSIVAAGLSVRPVVWLGLISYSLYLWHWPLFVFAGHVFGALTPRLMPGLVFLSILLAWLSWRFVEVPARTRPVRVRYRTILASWALTAAALVTVSIWAIATNGWTSHWRAQFSEAGLRYLDIQPGLGAIAERCSTPSGVSGARDTVCAVGPASGAPVFILWGDSHAQFVKPVFEAIAGERTVAGFSVHYYGCPPLLGIDEVEPSSPGCRIFNESILDMIKTRRIANVVLVGYWRMYSDGIESHNRYSRLRPFLIRRGNAVPTDRQESRTLFRQALAETLSALAAAGSRVVLLENAPAYDVSVPAMLAAAVTRGRDIRALGLPADEHRRRERAVDEAFRREAADGRVVVVDLASVFCAGIRCQAGNSEGSFYVDGHHLSYLGTMQLRGLVREIFDGFR